MAKTYSLGPTPDQELGLLQAAYDAAGTTEGWNRFLEAYVRVFGAAGAWAGFQPRHSHIPSITVAAGWSEQAIRAYREHFGAINPYRGLSLTKEVGRVYHVHELVPKSVVMRSEFYAGFVAPTGRHLAAVHVRLFEHSGGSEVAGLAVHYGSDRPEDDVAASMPYHQRLVPHIQSAMRLHYELLSLRSRADDLSWALETAGVAVVVCNNRGQVSFANGPAQRILDRNDGLGYGAEGLTAERCRGNRSLRRVLMETAGVAERRCTVVHTALRVERADERPDYELLLFPLPESQRLLRQLGGRVLVFIHDPGALPPTAQQVLASLYQLTARESEIVRLLADGHAPNALADRFGVSRETIKSHLKAAFAKTETRSQSQLLAKVLSGVGRYLRGRDR
jgi:DNA-binding CsgD family transcriptional regulator